LVIPAIIDEAFVRQKPPLTWDAIEEPLKQIGVSFHDHSANNFDAFWNSSIDQILARQSVSDYPEFSNWNELLSEPNCIFENEQVGKGFSIILEFGYQNSIWRDESLKSLVNVFLIAILASEKALGEISMIPEKPVSLADPAYLDGLIEKAFPMVQTIVKCDRLFVIVS
jgi:hypothetical protein